MLFTPNGSQGRAGSSKAGFEPDRVARLNVADLVIDLDPSRWRCFWRVLVRQIRGLRREEMPEGCIDKFSASEPPFFLQR